LAGKGIAVFVYPTHSRSYVKIAFRHRLCAQRVAPVVAGVAVIQGNIGALVQVILYGDHARAGEIGLHVGNLGGGGEKAEEQKGRKAEDRKTVRP